MQTRKKIKTKKFFITAIVISVIVISLISCYSTDKTKTNSVPKNAFVVTDSIQMVSYDEA